MVWWLSVEETPVGYYVVRDPRLPVVNPKCSRSGVKRQQADDGCCSRATWVKSIRNEQQILIAPTRGRIRN